MEPKMSHAIKLNKTYTYADYMKWNGDERWELIEGVPYNMTPAPMRQHQKLSREIGYKIMSFLQGKSCEVYFAPFDVRFPSKQSNKTEDSNIDSVVQPDISVICNKKKLDDRGCIGAPDFIIEIISKSTATIDTREKFALYEKHGVKEYWIVFPEEELVQTFILSRKKEYGKPVVYSFEDDIPAKTLKGLIVSLKDFKV